MNLNYLSAKWNGTAYVGTQISLISCPNIPSTNPFVTTYALATCDPRYPYNRWWVYNDYLNLDHMNLQKLTTNPSDTPLLLDSIKLLYGNGTVDGNQSYMFNPMPYGCPHLRHFKRANVFFCNLSVRATSASDLNDIGASNNFYTSQ